MADMTTANEMRDRLLDKATVDPDFRTTLLSDPKSAIAQELGVEIPDGLSVIVHENDANTVHLALPATELSEEQLEAVAAGRCCCCF